MKNEENFKYVFDKIILSKEGPYSNLINDIGKETCYGISRVYNKYWKGWNIIDELKNKTNNEKELKKEISKNIKINELVKQYYLDNYWGKLRLDYIDNLELIEIMFSSSIHKNTYKTIKWLQESLNLLNQNEKLYPDILEDGLIGNITIRTINKCLKYNRGQALIWIFKIKYANYLLENIKFNKSQEDFTLGWMNRIFK